MLIPSKKLTIIVRHESGGARSAILPTFWLGRVLLRPMDGCLTTTRRSVRSAEELLMAMAASSVKTTATRPTRAQKDAAGRLKQAQRAAVLLKQVSDATRLQVILMLSEGEKHVGALCDELASSQPAVSHHLALLRHGGIIAPRR